MSSEIAVSIRGISKVYHIYEKPLDRLKQALYRGRRSFYTEFWALRNVSFDVPKGSTVGIMGRNGSGKSTLLQIIAGILTPTTGEVAVRGRVASLLELGAGFNPEFTGRENVFLSGAVLGINREEMAERFEEVNAFADIGEFIDQPVKVYSSGMFVRLAFAVQVLLDPEVLIVDEILTVGDAAFQMKCINRMRQLSEKGVTILLVTHDVQTVRSFCHRAIWLVDGRVKTIGPPLEITSEYVRYIFSDQPSQLSERLKTDNSQNSNYIPHADNHDQEQPSPKEPGVKRSLRNLNTRTDLIRWGSGELVIEAATIDNGQPMSEPVFEYGERLHIEFQVRALQDIPSYEIGFSFAFRNTNGLDIIVSTTYEEGQRFPPLRAGQTVRLAFKLDNILAPGDYALVLAAEERSASSIHYHDFIENAVLFKVISKKRIYSLVLPSVQQHIMTLFEISGEIFNVQK